MTAYLIAARITAPELAGHDGLWDEVGDAVRGVTESCRPVAPDTWIGSRRGARGMAGALTLVRALNAAMARASRAPGLCFSVSELPEEAAARQGAW